MKRENIMALADDYASNYAEDYPFTKDTIIAAFVEGASRANQEHAKVWHSPSEEPHDGTHILMEYDYLDSKEYKSYHIDYDGLVNWKKLKKYFGISRWAYINDLLPKGGEQK